MEFSILHHNITIDTSTSETVKLGCRKVLQMVRPSWPDQDVQLKVFTDGLTNKLVGGWYKDKSDMVLIRIYGDDTEKFIDRVSEKINMKLMEEGGCGSKLYASFNNGISYEFVHGKVLELSMLFEPKVYREAARCLARMHKVKINDKTPVMWDFMNKLMKLYPQRFENQSQQEIFEDHLLSLEELKEEVRYLEDRLKDAKSPIVFCHNDAMPANMVLKDDGFVALIDLEYGGPNHAAYDIANLFNEYIGCDEVLNYKRNYPNEYVIKDWLFSYLTEFEGKEPSNAEVAQLHKEVCLFSVCGHLIWSTWAVIQAVSSQIEFDYLNYARQRINQYWLVKNS